MLVHVVILLFLLTGTWPCTKNNNDLNALLLSSLLLPVMILIYVKKVADNSIRVN